MADLKSRLTVVSTIYYRCVGGQPVSVESRFSRELNSDEQFYQRCSKVGEEPIPLDCGWLGANVGMVVITNDEGKNLQVHLSEEGYEDLAKRVIEVFYVGYSKGWLIPPGESFRGYPADAAQLMLRCLHGTAQLTINLVPS